MARREVSVSEKYFKENKLVQIPKKEKDKLEVFDLIRDRIADKGKVFNEKELNEVIKEIYSDFSIIRRYLVDYGYLIRDSYGNSYEVKEDGEQRVKLVDITDENFNEVIKVEMTKEQIEKKWVSDVIYTLAQAYASRYNDSIVLFALENEEEIVGFVALIKELEKKTVNIWRMIIDKEKQGQGLGKIALMVIENYIRELGVYDKIIADYVVGNEAMKTVLEKNGYVETGKQEEWNEIIMTKYLNKQVVKISQVDRK